MQITVRHALREELPRVNGLRRQVNELHVEGRPDIFRPGFCEELRQHVVELFDHPESSAVIVALVDGVVAGFASVQYVHRPQSPYNNPQDLYHVQEFGVDAAFRRRGVATALVDFMRADARERGFARIDLDAWAFNEGALAFYRRAGFRPYRWYFEMNTEEESPCAPSM